MYPEGKQILVIDDDTRRRQLIERILIEEGFAVSAVTQGFSAIRAVASSRFALAIAALSLPGTLDGLTTMRQLRRRQPWLKALLTGDIAQRPRRPDRTCDEFIPSPFHRRDLLGCVFELLQREILDGHSHYTEIGGPRRSASRINAIPERQRSSRARKAASAERNTMTRMMITIKEEEG